eukprot:2066121-Rhodomonas_salina.2
MPIPMSSDIGSQPWFASFRSIPVFVRQEVAQTWPGRRYRMGLFFGNATFFKCWVRICLYAGARVQLKRKMAPYMKRP